MPRRHVVPPSGSTDGPVTEMACYAGQSAGLVGGLPPAADVVATMAREAEERLRALAGALAARAG